MGQSIGSGISTLSCRTWPDCDSRCSTLSTHHRMISSINMHTATGINALSKKLSAGMPDECCLFRNEANALPKPGIFNEPAFPESSPDLIAPCSGAFYHFYHRRIPVAGKPTQSPLNSKRQRCNRAVEE